MDAVDSSLGGFPLRSVWRAFGHRAAVGGGALVALTSLLAHAPVWVASLRGALTWLAVLLVGRAGSWLIERTDPAPSLDVEDETGNPAEGEQAPVARTS